MKNEIRPVNDAQERIRFIHFEKGNEGTYRKFTIAYQHDLSTGELRYGASVFRLDPGEEGVWVHRAHNQTARERYRRRPVVLTFHTDPALSDYDRYRIVEKHFRDLVGKHGVAGERLPKE